METKFQRVLDSFLPDLELINFEPLIGGTSSEVFLIKAKQNKQTIKLVLRFEANSRERLNEIQNIFLNQLKTIDETINIKLS